MKETTKIAISVKNVSKVFKLPHEKLSTVKQHFVNIFNPKSYEKFRALDDVSFEIKQGEFFGIIGANGSGKSTLLKILAQIYQPTSGTVEINGTLSPFIELGVGFNPELTARENIFLNAAILGLTKKQTEEKFDEIVKFSELENFLDQKLKNFSSGMQVRLAFSIAIQSQAEILLIDEVLAVGDSAFQQKCFEVFRNLKKAKKTIIFVSHELSAVREFCDQVLLLSKGKVKSIDKPSKVLLDYLKLSDETKSTPKEKTSLEKEEAIIESVTTLDSKSERRNVINYGEDFSVEIKLNKFKNNIKNLGVSIYRIDNTYCFGINTFIDKVNVPDASSFRIKFSKPNLLPGDYYYLVAVFGENDRRILDYREKIGQFKIYGEGLGEGVLALKHSWEFE